MYAGFVPMPLAVLIRRFWLWQAEERILLTFDLDFGELAFRAGLPATIGIVLFRFKMTSAQQVARVVSEALALRTDWAGNFSVVDMDRIRMRPLPDRGR